VPALIGRARGLAVALVVLTLSAGAVLAGGDGPPAAADFGLETAGEASGQTVPVRADADSLEDEEGDEQVEEALPEGDEAAEETAETVAETTDGWANHGAMVSEAAQMDTPEGFDTHGAFVSCVARMNRGHLGPDADLTGLVLADLTPDDCDGDAEEPEEEAADADATSASTADGPGRSGEAKASKAAKGVRGLGHGANR
jgi:hypothetical protein